jgi:nickel/cobalt exporter
VGTRGTVKDAVLLGIVVTITHTLVIYILAAVAGWGALFWNQDEIERYLGAFAALLIMAVGITLIWSLWRRHALLGPSHPHIHGMEEGGSHQHPPEHGHAVASEPSRHSASDHRHTHTQNHPHPHTHVRDHREDHVHLPGFSHSHPEPEQMTSLSKVFLLGVSGGIVPCPEGLAVFLASVAGGQMETGLLLVMVFSLGLAATLMAVGIVFIKASRWFGATAGSGVWGIRVSWISALLITGVGAVYFAKYAIQFLE